MARSAASCSVSCASYGEAVLHKNAFSDEAASFHSAMKHCSVTLHNMKHSAAAPYDQSSIALRATDDEETKNESFRFVNHSLTSYIIVENYKKYLMMGKNLLL